MNYKRITLLCGHYGSGKTNIAVNMALDLRKQCDNVAIADLDIVNPYFRSADSAEDFEKAGVKLIHSEYANTNLDAPALPQEMYSIVHDRSMHAVVDVGGDDIGAVALGRLAPAIREENDYDMFFVINQYRPLTKDVESTLDIMHEIEAAAGIRFTAVINNSNLAAGTTTDTVLDSGEYAKEVAAAAGLPLALTTVDEALVGELTGRIENLYALKLQKRPV